MPGFGGGGYSMYGQQVFYIFQERDIGKYYYKGTFNNGCRVWTSKYTNSYTFAEKSEAIQFRDEMLNGVGTVGSKFV